MTVLQVEDVVKRFGGLVAVDHMRLSVEPGQIVALIGPNGAGKTTMFNLISGLLEADDGRVVLDGEEVTGLDVYQRARRGLARTFQRLEVFAGLTVAEHVQVALETSAQPRLLRALFALRHRDDPGVTRRTADLLARVGLTEVADTPAGDLSTGTLRLVELARALATEPRIVLLDEPASGLDASETAEMERLLRSIAADGIGILLVEHDVDLVMAVADHVVVMDFGRFVAEGPPEQVREDPAVIAAYLGVDEEHEEVGA